MENAEAGTPGMENAEAGSPGMENAEAGTQSTSTPTDHDKKYDAVSQAISRVLIPVMICMILSVWFVNSIGDPDKCREGQERPKILPIDPAQSVAESVTQTEYPALLAGIFIAVFIVLMITFTFLIVWLYKSGKRIIIQGWLMVAVFLIFSYVGGLYIFDFCRSHCIKLDWITLVLCVWNFAITGLIAIFGRVPRAINQAYLIIMSSLMAYIFRTLPAFAIWIILGALVLWDLFAVLTPWGPLNMLVEAARKREDDLPALVYDTNPAHPGREPNSSSAKASTIGTASKPGTGQSTISAPASVDPPTIQNPSSEPPLVTPGVSPNAESSAPRRPRSIFKKILRRSSHKNNEQSPDNAASTEPVAQDQNGEVQVGVMSTHLKLGLGDFVFYSILVAQASKSGPMTAIASFVAILAGLCSTLFLVTVMKRALPALPISIVLGLIAYFLTQYALVPYVENLLPQLIFY